MQRIKVDTARLNDAMWAACNTRWDAGCVPTMEKASEVALNAVRAYLGVEEDEWHEIVESLP